VRRGSISSICTVSTRPILTQSVDMLGNDDNHLLIRPELMQQTIPVCRNRSFCVYYSSTESLVSYLINSGTEVPELKTEQQHEEMFERTLRRTVRKTPFYSRKSMITAQKISRAACQKIE